MGGRGVEVGSFSACPWFALVAGVKGCVLAGIEIEVFLYISLYLRVLGWWVCACKRACTHTDYLGT